MCCVYYGVYSGVYYGSAHSHVLEDEINNFLAQVLGLPGCRLTWIQRGSQRKREIYREKKERHKVIPKGIPGLVIL